MLVADIKMLNKLKEVNLQFCISPPSPVTLNYNGNLTQAVL